MAGVECGAPSGHSLCYLQWRQDQHHDLAQTVTGGYLCRWCAPAPRVCSHQRRAGRGCTSEHQTRSRSSWKD